MWVSCAVLVLAVLMAGGVSQTVGVHRIDLIQAPFLVSVQDDRLPFCGASLLTLTHVLSACHCLGAAAVGMSHEQILPKLPISLTAVVGVENLEDISRLGQMKPIYRIMLHPGCSYQLILVYDFALGIANEPFIESSKVKPLGLFRDQMVFDENTKALLGGQKECLVAGWGSPMHVSTSIVNAVQMRVIPDAECAQKLGTVHKKFKGYDFAGNAQLCTLASGHQKNASDCIGDSGGPYFCGSQVYAVVSYGYECGQWDLPNVYAKLSYAVDWFHDLEMKNVRFIDAPMEERTSVVKINDDHKDITSGQDAFTMERLTSFPLLMLSLILALR